MAEAKRTEKTAIVRFRCTPEEKGLIEAWAAEDSRTASAFIRTAVLERIKAMKMRDGLGELFEFIKQTGRTDILGDAVDKLPRGIPPPSEDDG